MGFETPFIIIVFMFNSLTLSLIYYYLYRSHYEKSMGIWALSWLIYTSRYPFDLQQFNNPPQYLYLLFTQLTVLLSSFLLLWGTYSWIEKTVSKWWIGATGLLVFWLFLAFWMRPPFFIFSIPVFFFSGLVNIKTGFLFLHSSQKSSLSGYIIGGCFFIWGLHKWDYPFLREVPEFAPLGFLLSFLLTFWIGIGFLMLYYERSQHSLHQSDERFQLLFEEAPLSYQSLDRNGHFITVNKTWLDTLGYELHEVVGRWFGDFVAPDCIDKLRKCIPRLIKQGVIHNAEFQLKKKDGNWIFVSFDGKVAYDDKGCMKQTHCIFRDITELKRAESDLAESERRFREMLENVQIVAVTLDTNGIILFANDFLAQITGWNRQELPGKNWFTTFLPINCRDEVSHQFHKGITTGTIAPHFENEILKKNGEHVIIHWNNTILRGPQGDIIGTSSLGEDITRRKELEEQLLQSQKMESLGILAGGIAHDFNNLLTVILWYSQSIRDHAQSDSTIFKEAEEILKAGERASGLTRQLLMFSRKQFIQPKHINLNQLILNLEKILHRFLPENIELTFALDPNIGIIKADANQIEQIIMNTVVNAKDAMPRGGKLDIQTAPVYWKNEAETSRQHHSEGWYVSLRIQDTGCGMDEKTRSRIFDPFFTTKEVGKGTGLGLSTVYGVVEHCQGFIHVESHLGLGTTFLIYIPCTEEPILEDTQQVFSETWKGNETILLVEDNDNVRLMISSMLGKYGYTVHETCNGVEAINRFQSYKDSRDVDLLITDVIMPLMGGKELVEKLRSEHPSLKVLFMSGYSDQMWVDEDLYNSPGTRLLQKPFTSESLLKEIRDLLKADEKSGADLSAV